jgi:hypothetical protein
MQSDFEAQWGEIQFLHVAFFFSLSFTFYNHYILLLMYVAIFDKSRENIGARKEECYFRNDLSPLCEITTQVDFSSQKALSSSYLNDLLSLGPGHPYITLWGQNVLLIRACILWQYRLWSFQGRDTNLERFLAKNQL